MNLKINIAFLLLWLNISAFGATNYYVGTVDALSNALTSASSGDTVWLSNGTYTCITPMIEGQYSFEIKAGVIARSISGLPTDVVLENDAALTVPVVLNNGVQLTGVTVRNGYPQGGNFPAAIYGGTVSNCIITANLVGLGGSVVYGCNIFNSLIVDNPALFGLFECTAQNCTMINNFIGAKSSTLLNCISWGNAQPDDFSLAGSESFSDGIKGTVETPVPYDGEGSISTDPLFDGYHLQHESPCVDTGTNQSWMTSAKDLDGKARIYNSIVDMGAYEWCPGILLIRGTSITDIRAASMTNIHGRPR